MDYRMYILVNEDIKISKGKLAGQVGHAVMSYVFNITKNIRTGTGHDDYNLLCRYMDQQKKIILKCPQWRLEELEENKECVVIRDNGLTQLEPGTLTCVNYGIVAPKELPRWIRELKLYS